MPNMQVVGLEPKRKANSKHEAKLLTKAEKELEARVYAAMPNFDNHRKAWKILASPSERRLRAISKAWGLLASIFEDSGAEGAAFHVSLIVKPTKEYPYPFHITINHERIPAMLVKTATVDDYDIANYYAREMKRAFKNAKGLVDYYDPKTVKVSGKKTDPTMVTFYVNGKSKKDDREFQCSAEIQEIGDDETIVTIMTGVHQNKEIVIPSDLWKKAFDKVGDCWEGGFTRKGFNALMTKGKTR